jgi:hypothetical protein
MVEAAEVLGVIAFAGQESNCLAADLEFTDEMFRLDRGAERNLLNPVGDGSLRHRERAEAGVVASTELPELVASAWEQLVESPKHWKQ